MGDVGLRIIRPDGRPLETYGELALPEEQASHGDRNMGNFDGGWKLR